MAEPAQVNQQDRQSPDVARAVVRTCEAAVTLLTVGWILDVPGMLGQAFHTERLLALVYGCALAAVFVGRRARPGDGRVPIYDWFAAAVGFGVMLWVSVTYEHILTDLSMRTVEIVGISAVILALSLEGLRRITGTLLLVVIVVFIGYGLIGHLVPGALTANYVSPDHLISYLALDVNAMLGTPLRIGTTVVVAYVLFGQLLFHAGGGTFFTDLALATTGRTRGGSAKVAVIGSALFGTISGNATSNVASTGIITIPLMRQGGYSGVAAGAIEAVASTGGQFMPPVMGAAAFLMAEFISLPYSDIAIAATIPSLLYYWAVFVQVDLMAARHGLLSVVGRAPAVGQTLRSGIHFVIPFGVLIFGLFSYNLEPEAAAMYAVAVTLAGGALRSYDYRRLTFRGIFQGGCEAGATTIEMAVILASAGFVIGVLNVTGGGFALTLFLVDVAGQSLLVLLMIAACICMVLGMGMPTSGVYVLLAALIAPAIVEAGVDILSAHMFILYYGMLSAITPPVALACFAAAVLSKEDPMRTALAAVRLGWVAYLIPFMFVLSPSLLFKGSALEIVINGMTAFIGVYFCSIGLVGYFVRRMSVWMRILVGLSGLMAILPGTVVPYGNAIVAVGVAVGTAFLGWELANRRRSVAVSGLARKSG